MSQNPRMGSVAQAIEPFALTGINARGLDELAVDELLAAVDERGVVLLRGYEFCGDTIARLAERLFARFFIHGGARERVSDDDRVQLAEVGTEALRVHCEMAYTPLRPDLCLFACAQAPRADGETLICDGLAVADALEPGTRERFAAQAFVHVRRYAPATWQRTFKTTSLEVLRAALASMDGLEYEIDADEGLRTRYRSWAFTEAPGRWRAFANSLASLVDQRDGHFPYVEWASGEAIAVEDRLEVMRAIDACTVAHSAETVLSRVTASAASRWAWSRYSPSAPVLFEAAVATRITTTSNASVA